MQNLLMISACGVVGVLCRYGVDQYFGSWNEQFPATTFLINILGAFLAGCIFVLGTYRDLSSTVQTALLVGFCGGFTTFSAYALQTLVMFDRGRVMPALAYLILSPVAGLLAAFVPVLIARRFFA